MTQLGDLPDCGGTDAELVYHFHPMVLCIHLFCVSVFVTKAGDLSRQFIDSAKAFDKRVQPSSASQGAVAVPPCVPPRP